jgi:hypothetical protein
MHTLHTALRGSGTLTVTCGAAATSFTVTQPTSCQFVMVYATTQACPVPWAAPQ